MRAKIGAMVAAVAAAASAAGATVWARRRRDDSGPARGPGRAAPAPMVPPEPAAATPGPEPAAKAKPAREPAAAGAGTGTADADRGPKGQPPSGAEPPGHGDDLTAIKGLGAVSESRLREIGVTSYAQVAAWSDEDIDEVGARIRVSPERIRREDWVGQARALVAG